MEELIAQQCEIIARLQAEIEEARSVAEREFCEMDGASTADLFRQMAHNISEVQRDAYLFEKQATKWEEKADKLQTTIDDMEENEELQMEYDDLVEENENTLDAERVAIEDAIEDLLMALGHPRRPIGSTGVKELDHLAWLVF